MSQRAFISGLAEDIGADTVRVVAGLFEADCARLLARMADAAVAHDPAEFRRAAHGLAGAAGAVGAATLERTCRDALAHINLHGVADLTSLHAGIAAAGATSVRELAVLLGELPATG
jgi:hypothetical protein